MAKANAVAAFLAGLALASPAAAQTRIFTDDVERAIVIEAPMDSIVRRAARTTDAYPGTLTLRDGPRFDVELQARGMFRRISGSCTFPPLRLDFQGAQVRGTAFHGQNRLKLVTRCRSNFEHLLALEYTAYRLFNAITPQSFRVQPLEVTYRDTEGRRREETQFNFLIEDIDDVARRNRLVAIDVERRELNSAQLDPRAATTVALFQYMIGNLDWDYLNIAEGRSCCHNINHLAASATSRESVIPVPYDFDHSGFVDAPYATPPEGVAIRSVRTRVYRGYCRHNDQLPAVRDLFLQRREQIYAAIDGETRLTAGQRAGARRYIEGFYEIADDPAEWNRQIVERCRGQSGAATAG